MSQMSVIVHSRPAGIPCDGCRIFVDGPKESFGSGERVPDSEWRQGAGI